MDIELILNYQQIDKELLGLERAIKQSDDAKKYQSLSAMLQTVKEDIAKYEREGGELILIGQKLKGSFLEILETIDDLKDITAQENINLFSADENSVAEIKKYQKKAESLEKTLSGIEREHIAISKKLVELDVEIKKSKKKLAAIKDEIAKVVKAIEDLKASKAQEAKVIVKKLRICLDSKEIEERNLDNNGKDEMREFGDRHAWTSVCE